MYYARRILLALFAVCAGLCWGQSPNEGFVGGRECAQCHRQQYQGWQGSHHDLAMQQASPETVLGNFNNVEFSYYSTVSRFYRRKGDYFVETEGADGKPQEFKIEYTFGIEPLQQYLVAFPGGRLQALTLAWDSRSREEGGQRWFHLQPDEFIDHTDELHWTGSYFNWNSRCAECHSTSLRKNFSLADNTYETTWSDIDVSCEACHGPGEKHVQWAKGLKNNKKGVEGIEANSMGLVELGRSGIWQTIADISTAKKISSGSGGASVERTASQVDVCAHCHSRRSMTTEDFFGKSFADTHALQLLDEGIYHPDGQVLDEDYVYGSFIQSKMYHQGVVCSDCHDAHSLKLKQPGNQVCTQCHSSEVFDTPKHHHHSRTGMGSLCADCHMPETTYMVVDDRRDHSLRIPRPDLSLTLGVPNACNQCHRGKSAQWAATAVESWYPKSKRRGEHFGHILAIGQRGGPQAPGLLARLANDGSQPGIARATALRLLGQYPQQQSLDALARNLRDKDPLVKISALQGLVILPVAQRFPYARSLLSDASPRVRAEAGRVLAGTPSETLSPKQAQQLQAAMDEYVAMLMVNSDIANNHLNLASLYEDRGELQKAEAAYNTALRIDSKSVLSILHLVELYRRQKRDHLGEPLLKKALSFSPGNAAVHHSLGLLYVRLQKTSKAMTHLGEAVHFGPDNVRYAYVYSVALDSVNQTNKAIEVISQALQRYPNDRDLLNLKDSFTRKMEAP